MNRLSLMLKTTAHLAAKNSPTLLAVAGSVGVLATAFFSGKASFKAAEVLNKREKDRWPDDEDLELQEKVDLTWKLYIPAAGVALVTIACVVAADRINARRVIGIAAAYSTSQQMYQAYREKVSERIGPKKEEAVRADAAQDRIDKIPVASKEFYLVENGEVPCFDEYSGRLFRSSMQKIREAEVEANFNLLGAGYLSLSDFWNLLGLDSTKMGDALGWNTDHKIVVDVTTVLHNNLPALSIGFSRPPNDRFDRFH